MSSINQRKQEHLNLLQTDQGIERGKHYFDAYQLNHRGMPEIALNEVDIGCEFIGKRLSMPFIISSMTGGNDQYIVQFNQQLAEVAQASQVAMGVGSQRIMISDKASFQSFRLRQYAPTIPLIANVGAVQLNYGLTLKDVLAMIDVLEADALYLHFNPLQEAIQPEGDTNFSKLQKPIAQIVKHCSVTVIAKEVGSGFSVEDLHCLKDTGIEWVDVAGSGGTSWSRLEGHRRGDLDGQNLGHVFQDWGIPTPLAIEIAKQQGHFQVIASGGIRNGLDMVKAMALGAQMCASAAPIFHAMGQSADDCLELLNNFQQQIKTAFFLLGCKTQQELQNRPTPFIQRPS